MKNGYLKAYDFVLGDFKYSNMNAFVKDDE